MKKVGTRLLGLLVLTTAVVSIGAAQKAPCANTSWVERRVGVSIQCYSDVAELYKTEQLSDGRLPYLDQCQTTPDPCDEYPALSMYVMRLTAWMSSGGDPYARFYVTNFILLLICALTTTYCLERVGAKTLMFAAAPVLAIYGTMNWDLVPVALSTVAFVALLDDRFATAGASLGVGAAAKIYPALMLLPFGTHARQQRGDRAAIKLVAAGAGAWLVINLPFAIAAPNAWATFFRFNANRAAEYDTIWRVLCSVHLCTASQLVNEFSVLLPFGVTAWLWRTRTRNDPDTPLWAATFPLLVSFVLFNKVWSPQYALWLLPWFALAAPTFLPYIAWQASEVLVFVTRFAYFGDLERGNASYAAFGTAVAIRTVILVWCLVAWSRSVEGYPDPSRVVTSPPLSVPAPS